jgi:cytochrome b6-f complex iron-sulfur subunit
MTEQKVSRKDFLKLIWGAAGAAAAAEFSLVGLRFLSPRNTTGEFGGVFNIGDYTQIPLGTVTPVEAGRFYLVRLDDGGFLAIYRRCTHLGCAVPFDQASREFVCPCHGSQFTIEGDVQNQPATRPLDLFELTITDLGEIIVNTGKPIERDRISRDQITYA